MIAIKLKNRGELAEMHRANPKLIWVNAPNLGKRNQFIALRGFGPVVAEATDKSTACLVKQSN
jgi:hypothetical protein